MYSSVLVLVVVYNLELNNKIIQNLFCIKDINYLVIDNSDNKTNFKDKIKSLSNVAYISNYENLGIATALNIGCQYALDKGYDWVVTMDQDSKLTLDILTQLVYFANVTNKFQANTAVISPRHVLGDNTYLHVPDEETLYSEGLCTMSSGNLLNLKIWKKLGKFADLLFIDMVDVEYYCRAISNGYKIITLNKLYMKHSLGNLKRVKFLGKSIKVLHHGHERKYYQIRNTLLVYFKYKNKVPGMNVFLRFTVFSFIKILFEEDKCRKVFFMFRGLIDFLRRKMGKLT